MVNLFATLKSTLVFLVTPAQILINMSKFTMLAHHNLVGEPLESAQLRKNYPPGFYKVPPDPCGPLKLLIMNPQCPLVLNED